MPKKLLISTLIAAGALASSVVNILPASAETYWTYDEVQAESEKYLEHRKMCKGNQECESYLETAYILTEDVHSAARSFADNYFMITAIDPETSTIKVLFHDYTASRWTNVQETDVFKNLYLFWWENGQPQFIVDVFTGVTNDPNRREIYTHEAAEGEVWLSANREVEIPISKEAIEVLKTTPIYWEAKSTLSESLSVRHFESCLTEIEGQPGYECRAVFDFMGNITYQKTEKKKPLAAPAPTPTPEITEKISTSIIRVPEIVTEVVHDSVSEGATDSVGATTEVAEPTKDFVEVPLAAGKAEDHQFPWWLVIFAFSGIFLILWWLIPAKKVEKSLDSPLGRYKTFEKNKIFRKKS